jgi:hypothetical protein
MNFPPRVGRDFGRATPSLRHAQRAKPRNETNPAGLHLIFRGNLFRQAEPDLKVIGGVKFRDGIEVVPEAKSAA